MAPSCVDLTGAATSVHLLKLNGFCATGSMVGDSDYIKSRWNVDGYDWEVRCYPSYEGRWVMLKLVFLGRAGARTELCRVRAALSCRLVQPSGNLTFLGPSKEVSEKFYYPGYPSGSSSDPLRLVQRCDIKASSPGSRGYLHNDGSVTVECTITVLRELPDVVIPPATTKKDVPLPLPTPSSNLHQHLGELLKNQKGSDITFVLVSSGERFTAHKNILATRSPVFMAEFFGHMSERSSEYVQIKDMEAAVFRAILHFIYTDTAPELDDDEQQQEMTAAVTMAQHLLVAADRYGLDRLKHICEARLCGGIDVDTAATTLALAEQHDCKLLKARCVEFITGSTETLDAVVATEGYRHLATSCPMVLAELLKAARERKD